MTLWQNRNHRTFRQDLPLLLLAILWYFAVGAISGCGGGDSSTNSTTGATTLDSYAPPSGQIVVGCVTDGSLAREDVTVNGTTTPGMLTFISRVNTDLAGWFVQNWQIGAQVVEGAGDGRYCVVFTSSPTQSDQGYSVQAGGVWQCTCNMPLSLQEGTPFTSASHELYNTLVSTAGGPRICGPVSPLCDGNLLTDATTRSYWSGGNPPYDKMRALNVGYPSCVAGGAIGL